MRPLRPSDLMNRPLNLGRYKKYDVVRHYRTERILVVLGDRWRSELLRVKDAKSGVETLYHPRFLDPVDTAMLVLAANHAV